MPRTTLVVLTMIASLATPAFAQSTIFIVRHAERADGGGAASMNTDPDLSDAGRRRAESLSTVLKDAQIVTIFVTEFKRTQQTAAPLARALGIELTAISSRDTASLVKKLESAPGNVLVVGHSNTVPEILTGLGVTTPVTIGDSDYDNLFIVTRGSGPPRLLHLHYP
jgi:phosphohistidine phosphatase SixA